MTLSGFLNVDKPSGMTSHDVVSAVKRAIRQHYGVKVKVGHAGTLDPLATGVLVVCLGSATRLSEYVMAGRKTYQARVRLGETTDTYDSDGQITAQTPCDHITHEQVQAALLPLTGDILQVPPMYSAVKIGGKKLYELARKGEDIERPARPVTIYDLAVQAWGLPEFTLEVTCSAGTYIRTLAHDLGEVLGVGAHLTALRRTRSGAFDVSGAVSLDILRESPDWTPFLVPPEDGLADWFTVTLDASALAEVQQGRRTPVHAGQTPPDEETLARALSADDGRLVGILRAVRDLQGMMWQPHKILH